MEETLIDVLFLDVDGVLNSHRTCFAFYEPNSNCFPWTFDPSDLEKFDWIAVRMLRKVCEQTKCKVIISSTWRVTFPKIESWLPLGLPVIGMTDTNLGCRGDQIQRWLDSHPEVRNYAILDDNSDMLKSQEPHFVQTPFDDGLQYAHAKDLVNILSGGSKESDKDQLIWNPDE